MSLPISLKVGIHNDSYFTKEHKDALPATAGALYVSCFEDVKGYLYYDNGTNFINIVPRLLGEENGGTGINLTTIPANSTLIQGASGTLSSIQSKAGVYFSAGTNEPPQFGVVPVKYGGTGLTSHTTQGVLYAKNENTLATSGTFLYNDIPGTATQVGENQLILGNNIASGTAGNGRGTIKLFGNSKGSITFRYSTTATEDVVAMYPAYDGNVTISMNTVHDVEDKITTFYLPFYVNANQRLSYNTGLYCMSQAGTTAQNGVSYLCIGNGTASGSKNNKYGILRIFTTGTAYQNLRATGSTSRTTYLRDHGANAYLVSTPADGTAYGSEILPVYVNTNGMITACKGSSIFGALSWVAGTSNGPTLKATIAGYERTATIPSASTSASGIVTTGNQTFKGVKTFDTIKLTSADGKTSTITYSDKTSSVSVDIPAYSGNITISMTDVHDTSTLPSFALPFYVNDSKRISYNDGINCMTRSGTASEEGASYIKLGNATVAGVAGNRYGAIRLYASDASFQNLRADTGAENRTTYLRDHGENAYVVSTGARETAYGSASLPVYVNERGLIKACTGSSIFSSLSWAGGDANGPTLKLTVAGHERTAVIPSASATASGIVTTGNQTFSGEKTFSTVKATTFTGDLEGAAKVAKALRVTLTNPAESTAYYPTFVSGTAEGTNFTPRVSDGLRYISNEGTASANGAGILTVGNNVGEGTAGNKRGAIRIYALDTTYCQLRALKGSSNTYSTYLRDHGCSAYNVSAATTSVYGDASTPVYVDANGLITTCSGDVVTESAQSFKGFKTWINGSIWRMTNDLVKGTAPTAKSENYIAFCDKNGSATANRIGMLYCETSTSNVNRFTMFAYKPESGVTTNASFSIYYPASGVAYAITAGVEYLKTKRFAVYDASYGTAEPAAADGLIAGQIYFKII